MKPWLYLPLTLLICFAIQGCSGNNVGDIFPPFGEEEGDPGDGGFDPPTGGTGDDGSFTLNSLEPGAIFKPGGPILEAHYPMDGSEQVDVNTLVVFRFSETMNPTASVLEKGIQVLNSSNSEEVPGSLRFAEPAAKTILVFEPDDPFEDEIQYEVSVGKDLEDAQGSAYDPGEGEESTLFTFTTGKDGDEVVFDVIPELTYPAADAVHVSDGASVLVFFTEAVDTTDSDTGLGNDSTNLSIQDQDANNIAGARNFDFGDRLFVFTPNIPLPGGKRIDVRIEGEVEAADGSESLTTPYETSFTVVGFPRVTAITFPDNDPLVVLPASIYQGVINLNNQGKFKVTVTLKGAGGINKLTLLFWDNKSHARIIVITGSANQGEHTFSVDLQPGTTQAILDGDITVGAYTTSEVDSAVGPGLVLPLLKKDVVQPQLTSLGPPNLGSGVVSFDMLSEAESPLFHGTATETLSKVTITPVFYGTELDPVEAIRFFSMQYPAGSGIYSESVTRGGSNLFITEPVDFTPGGFWPVRGDRSEPPILVKQIVVKDQVGNTKKYTEPNAGSFSSRGFFINNFPGLTEALRILCYDSVTLHPLEDVDAIVENRGTLATPKSLTWATYSNGPGPDVGEAAFADFLGSAAGDLMILTLVRDGYQVLSMVWLYDGANITSSLPLVPETSIDLESTVPVVMLNATGADLPDTYFGGNRIITGEEDLLHYAGVNQGSTSVTVNRNQLQFLEGLGVDTSVADQYQWAWSNPFISSGENTTTQTVLFQTPVSTPAADQVQPLEVESKLGPTATRYAYGGAKLNGFLKILPLGADRTEVDLGGDIYAFRVPLPPSLFINEIIAEPLATAAFDPPYEVVIEPALGRAENDTLEPDQALLEEQILFEVGEYGDTGTPPPRVGKRIEYAQANLGDPPIPLILPDPLATPVALNPPAFEFQWDHVLTGMGYGGGVYTLHFQNGDGSRHWTTYMSYQAAGALATASYLYPDLPGYWTAHQVDLSPLPNDYDSFIAAGDYPFHVEAFHLTGYILKASFLSTIEREWKTYWRSDPVIVNNP